MSNVVTPVASYRGSSAGSDQRSWSLALAFQEVMTAIVRVRFGRQAVQNADAFRAHLKESLRVAAQQAMEGGYSQEDTQLALYAIVAFLDESVLNCRQPAFAEWPRLPLQEELFGGHVAGESFFANLQRIVSRPDSAASADLLEVFYLCLLLGYQGRYAVTGAGDLRGIMEAVRDKVQRSRGGPGPLSPRWALPAEAVQAAPSDPWVKRLGWAAVACLALALLLFGGFKLGLSSSVNELHTISLQGR